MIGFSYYTCIFLEVRLSLLLRFICQVQMSRSHLQPFPKQALVFMCLQFKSFENTVGKEEIAHNEQYLLFPQCFLPIWRTFCHFHQIKNCQLQTLTAWKGKKFVVWERIDKENVIAGAFMFHKYILLQILSRLL